MYLIRKTTLLPIRDDNTHSANRKNTERVIPHLGSISWIGRRARQSDARLSTRQATPAMCLEATA